MKNAFVIDTETNGFLDVVTELHCASLVAFDTEETTLYSSADKNLDTAYSVIESADILIGHNIIGYDIPVLEKLKPGTKFTDNLIDTMVMSQVLHPALAKEDAELRPGVMKGLSGKHSLEAWGVRLGLLKISFEKENPDRWKVYTPEMGTYCNQDTAVTLALFKHLSAEVVSSLALDNDTAAAKVVQRQVRYGFLFDEALGQQIDQDLLVNKATISDELTKMFPDKFTGVKKLKKPAVITQEAKSAAIQFLQKLRVATPKEFSVELYSEHFGNLAGYPYEPTVPKRNNGPAGYTAGRPFTKIIWQSFNPGSPLQLAERLMELGWVPDKFTDKGNPKTDQEALELAALTIPEAKPISEYLLVNKLISTMSGGKQSLLNAIKPDGRIHGSISIVGTPHARMAHFSPNIAQVPKPSKKYAERFRECFIVPEGKVLIGIDASGIQLRMLAHYLQPFDDGRYIEACVDGDIHWLNSCDLGLPGTERPRVKGDAQQDHSRDNVAKPYIYGTLFGAGIPLLAANTGYSRYKVKKLQDTLYERNPAFLVLMEKVKKVWRKKGYLTALDGRVVPCSSDRLGLCYILTSGEACVMKRALVIFDDTLQAAGLVPGVDYEFVANVHDEWQIEAYEKHVEVISNAGINALKQAGEELGCRCPLTGEAKVGKNWAETH